MLDENGNLNPNWKHPITAQPSTPGLGWGKAKSIVSQDRIVAKLRELGLPTAGSPQELFHRLLHPKEARLQARSAKVEEYKRRVREQAAEAARESERKQKIQEMKSNLKAEAARRAVQVMAALEAEAEEKQKIQEATCHAQGLAAGEKALRALQARALAKKQLDEHETQARRIEEAKRLLRQEALAAAAKVAKEKEEAEARLAHGQRIEAEDAAAAQRFASQKALEKERKAAADAKHTADQAAKLREDQAWQEATVAVEIAAEAAAVAESARIVARLRQSDPARREADKILSQMSGGRSKASGAAGGWAEVQRQVRGQEVPPKYRPVLDVKLRACGLDIRDPVEYY